MVSLSIRYVQEIMNELCMNLLGLAQALEIDQLVVTALVANQLLVVSAFNDLPLIKHVDNVGFLDRTKSMRHSNRCSTTSGGIQRGLDDLLRFRIKGRRGFVEKQDFGVSEQSTRNGHSLFLPSRQHASFAANHGVESLTAHASLG